MQIPVAIIHRILEAKLTGTQHDLLLYLWKLDPYGDQWVEAPPPEEIALLLKVDPRTIQRAAQRLEDCELFEFQIQRWKVKNTTVCSRFPQNSTDKGIQLTTKRSKSRKRDRFVRSGISLSEVNETLHPKPVQGEAFTNSDVPNKETDFSDLTEQFPPTHPVSGIDSEGIGTIAQILTQAEEAGIRLNKTIRVAVEQLTQQIGEPAAAVRLRNALSAVQERQVQGIVRNPGGMFVAALKEGYTANQAKREARQRSHPSPATSPPTKPPLDTLTVSKRVDLALMSGDRVAAISQLQRLWDEGWQDAIEELCLLHKRDWHFTITAQGVRDGAG